MKLIITKGGPGSGHRGHAGRKGKVGGSVSGSGSSGGAHVVAAYDDIKESKYIRDQYGITNKGYFITNDGGLIDLADEFGGGSNDHIGAFTTMENPELVGLTASDAKGMLKAYEDLYGEDIGKYWEKIHKNGTIRVREFGDEIIIDTYNADTSTLRRLQSLYDSGKLGLSTNSKITWSGLTASGYVDTTYEEFLNAHYVVNRGGGLTLKEDNGMKLILILSKC